MMHFPTRTIRDSNDWESFAHWFAANPDPYPFRVVAGEERTLSQNATIHMWFGQIAVQRGDTTPKEVKGEMHRAYALDVRLADPQFEWIWNKIGAPDWNYERQCNFLASEVVQVSSAMTTKQLSTYADQIQQHAIREGWTLTQPKEKK